MSESIVRIELVGLFRIVRHGEGSNQRVVALAPWTGPTKWLGNGNGQSNGKPKQNGSEGGDDDNKADKIELHHFAVTWWPRDVAQQNIAPHALAIWPLAGMDLSFRFLDEEDRDIEIDLDTRQWDRMRVPTMVPDVGATGAAAVLPASLREAGRVRPDLLTRQAGQFDEVDPNVPSLTNHLGFKRNKQGIVGRVIIDRGEVVTDDLTDIEASVEPSAVGSPPYRDHFTNRVSIIADDVHGVEMSAHNLITGNLASRTTLRLPKDAGRGKCEDRYLFVRVSHLCARDMFADCMDPALAPRLTRDRDDDFAYLYDLSNDPKRLREGLQQITAGKLPPVPTRYEDPNSCSTTRCGSCKENS